jgi:coenzyme PQQ biosynthesis protein PqqD
MRSGETCFGWRRFALRGQDTSMPAPEDSSQPRLAPGCRWAAENKTGSGEERIILFPEGAIKLQGTGRQILERCDGQRTFGDLIKELQAEFSGADPAKIRDDISKFLEQLQHKRIVDY